MAKKYIDADDALTIVFTLYDSIRPITLPDGDIRNAVFEAYKAIDHLPAADVQEVRHGRWIKGKIMGLFKCSACHNTFDYWVTGYNHCPNCGARMEGEENG